MLHAHINPYGRYRFDLTQNAQVLAAQLLGGIAPPDAIAAMSDDLAIPARPRHPLCAARSRPDPDRTDALRRRVVNDPQKLDADLTSVQRGPRGRLPPSDGRADPPCAEAPFERWATGHNSVLSPPALSGDGDVAPSRSPLERPFCRW